MDMTSYVGSTARDLMAALSGKGHVGRMQEAMLVGGLVMLLVSIVGIGGYVKRALAQLEQDEPRSGGGDVEMGTVAAQTDVNSPKCK